MKPPFSFEAFLDFVNRKDPDERYLWTSAEICACGQYAESLGFKNWNGHITSDAFWTKANQIAKPEHSPEVVFGPSAFHDWHDTWGNLSKRLKQAIKEDA